MTTGDLVVLALLLGCMTAYIPVGISLFFAAAFGFLFFTEMPVLLLVQTLLKSLDNFALVVVLFFIFCGNIMTSGSIVEKLIRVADVLVGRLPGGLGMAGVVACALFGAISGSTVATVVAIGGVMIPVLKEQGYNDVYAVGLMATSPNLGVIIPPSIGMILYSMISNVSLEALFLTGFFPGLLIVLGICLYTGFLFHKDKKASRREKPSPDEVVEAFREGFWALLLPVIIFGGIFSGAFTANEAAVVACVYALVVELFIHRSITFKEVRHITVNSAVTSATLLIIVAGATCFGRYLTFENVPGRLTEGVLATVSSDWGFLLVINLLLLVVGMFMDIISATLILGPVLIPMLVHYSVDPIHFGLILTVNLAIGYCTPPMGVSLFITGSIAQRGILFVSRSVLPFLFIQLTVLALITFIPELVMWLPRLLR